MKAKKNSLWRRGWRAPFAIPGSSNDKHISVQEQAIYIYIYIYSLGDNLICSILSVVMKKVENGA
jgi:hypothetical protein